VYHFWVDSFPSGVRAPGVVVGTAGLAGVIVVATAVAAAVFRSMDVSG